MRRFLGSVLMATSVAAGAAATDAAPQPVILVWGDSLSAAYGIPAEQGWVQRLQQRLRGSGYPHRVVNGSISGETTAGGLARLPAALKQHRPALVLLELGGNDGLRGLPVKQLRANLAAMIGHARGAGAKVMLFEMQIPANYGDAYRSGFARTYRELAGGPGVTLVPFFLEAIALDAGAFQEDGIHPTAAAQEPMLDAVWPVLRAELGPARAASRSPAQP